MDDSARAGGTPEIPPGSRERSVIELVTDIIGNAQEVMRSEIRLAKAEIREEASAAARAAAMMAAGGVIGTIAAVFLLICVTLLLSHLMPDWAAALLVGLGLAGSPRAFSSKGARTYVYQFPKKRFKP